MSEHKLVMLCIIFGLSILFFFLAFCRKKKDKVDWSKIQLNDGKDRAYALPSDDVSSLQSVKRTIIYNKRASQRVALSEEWVNSLDRLVRAAYTIYRNADSPQYAPSSSTYQYFKMLYYRSVKAGKMLETAENTVGEKVLALHRIRFDSISSEERKQIMVLQKELPKLQSLLCKEKHRVWNNTHKLKYHFIKHCGSQGNSWYWHNFWHRKHKYGKYHMLGRER